MTKAPLVSIITVNLNNFVGLKKTMTSVFEQTWQEFEYLVIDGGSTDGSKEYIGQQNEKLDYWISEPDSGIYNAMNKGIDKAAGEYLLFLNSGDFLWKNEVLDSISKTLLGGKDLYYGNIMMDYNGHYKENIYPDKLSFSYFYNRGHLPHPATFIKHSLFKEVYKFKEEFKIVSDFDFLVCAVCKHNASYEHFDRIVTVYDTTGVSSNLEYREEVLLKERELSLRSNFPMFMDDTKRLIDYDNLMKTYRFKQLKFLEGNQTAEKLNDMWLKILSKIMS